MTNLRAEISELQEKCGGLTSITESKHGTVISGRLSFDTTAQGLEPIADWFDIEVHVRFKYPQNLPMVREVGGKIPDSYPHSDEDGTLCLGVPVDERRIFSQQPSLLGFVDRLVIPFLYGYCHWQRYGKHPFGEHKHGDEGIVQYYVETLELDAEVIAMSVVCFLYEHGYQGNQICPCGKKRIVRKCHGPMLRELHRNHTRDTLRHDLGSVLRHCRKKCGAGELCLPLPLKKQIRRITGKARKQGIDILAAVRE